MLNFSGRARAITTATLLTSTLLVGAAQGAAGARGTVPTVYQSAVSTTVTISNTPRAQSGDCVDVNVSVTSDAGTPTGTVTFSVDGTAANSAAVPAGGTVTQVIGCSRAARFRTLSLGPHTLAAQFVPSGNWAPSHGSGQVVITAGAVVNPTSLPTGVDAGLGQFGAASSSAGIDPRPWISGTALVLAIGFVARFRRRARG